MRPAGGRGERDPSPRTAVCLRPLPRGCPHTRCPQRAAPRRGCAPAVRVRRLLTSSCCYFCKHLYGRSALCAMDLLGALMFTSSWARPPAPRPGCVPCGRCPGLPWSPVPAVPSPPPARTCSAGGSAGAARGAGRCFAVCSGLPREQRR